MPTGREAEALVVDALRAHLSRVKVTRVRGPKPVGDLVLKHPDGSTAAVEVKTLSSARHEDLIGRLATSALQMKTLADSGGRAAIVLVVPRATAGAAQALGEFGAQYAPTMGWGLADDQGALFLHLPFWNRSVSERPHPRAAASVPTVMPALFSDLHAWILKVLLLADVQPPLWSGPRGPVTTVEEIQQECGVSRMTAYRFLQTLESEDFVVRSGGTFALVRRPELVRRWFDYVRHVRFEVLYARASGEPRGVAEILSDVRVGLRWAVAGFAACKELGVLRGAMSTGEVEVSEVYVEDVGKAIEGWRLEACGARDAQVVLVRTPFAESTFRGAMAKGRVRVVDGLQAALDVSRHAGRGVEQAGYVVREVLGWKEVRIG